MTGLVCKHVERQWHGASVAGVGRVEQSRLLKLAAVLDGQIDYDLDGKVVDAEVAEPAQRAASSATIEGLPENGTAQACATSPSRPPFESELAGQLAQHTIGTSSSYPDCPPPQGSSNAPEQTGCQ